MQINTKNMKDKMQEYADIYVLYAKNNVQHARVLYYAYYAYCKICKTCHNTTIAY